MRTAKELVDAFRNTKTATDAVALLPAIGLLSESEDSSTFGQLLSDILDREDLASAAIVSWLCDTPAEQAAQLILRERSVRYLQSTTPAEVDLSAVSPEGATLAARRMNRMAAAPAFVLGWVIAILRRWPKEECALAACDAVLHYLVLEFPDPMHDLMSNLSSGAVATEPWQLLEHYLDQLKQERHALSTLPWLHEFEMSAREAEVMRVLRQKTNDQIVRHAESQSVFAQFATRFRFKYSHRVMVPAGESETRIQMQELGAQTHMPLSEWSDPLEGIKRRRELWSGETQ